MKYLNIIKPTSVPRYAPDTAKYFWTIALLTAFQKKKKAVLENIALIRSKEIQKVSLFPISRYVIKFNCPWRQNGAQKKLFQITFRLGVLYVDESKALF